MQVTIWVQEGSVERAKRNVERIKRTAVIPWNYYKKKEHKQTQSNENLTKKPFIFGKCVLKKHQNISTLFIIQ